MERFCITAADGLLSPSRFLAQRIERALQTEPIPNIPLPTADPVEDAPAEGERGDVLYVGRLQLLKGVLPLLEACRRMWSEGADFRLTMIGGDTRFTPRNTTVRAYVEKRYAAEIDGGRLVLAGPVPHAQVQARMRRAWCVVVPSLWENFPYVCIEAMSAGQLVIASTSGGQAEMVAPSGENGLVFDWERDGDFEDKLRRALAIDTAERRAIGARAQQRIREMSAPQNVLERRIRHYQQLIDRHAPRRTYPTLPEATAPGAPRNTGRDRSEIAPDEAAGLLTVVIPYYNLGEYVDQTLASVLASTYEPIEILIVNDGSTDAASIAKLEQIRRRDLPRVRIETTANQGLAATRNWGADHARGQFVCFLDADDCVEPDYFTRAIALLKRYPNVDSVYPWVRYFGASDSIWPTFNAEFPYLLAQNMAAAFSVIRRRSFRELARNKPEVAYALEDHEGWISLIEAGGVAVSLPHPLMRYRVRPDSMLQTSTTDQRLYLYDLITKFHPRAYRDWGAELLNLQNANGSGRTWVHPTQYVREPAEYIAELEKTRDELRELARGWETQAAHIQSQSQRIQELDSAIEAWRREAERLVESWETQRRHIEAQDARIADLEREATGWCDEATRLAQAWVTQKAHIEAQAARIEALERDPQRHRGAPPGRRTA
jgi:glycosyltransferase involved in cell wall biosynthesis